MEKIQLDEELENASCSEEGVDVDDLIQVTPILNIKKIRKRKLKNCEEEEDEKEYEKNGIFFYEKQKFITTNKNFKILITYATGFYFQKSNLFCIE